MNSCYSGDIWWSYGELHLSGFNLSWLQGFGDVLGEHWLGNEVLHRLTSQGHYSLRVELKDWEGNSAHSQFDRFSLTNERQQYRYYTQAHVFQREFFMSIR